MRSNTNPIPCSRVALEIQYNWTRDKTRFGRENDPNAHIVGEGLGSEAGLITMALHLYCHLE